MSFLPALLSLLPARVSTVQKQISSGRYLGLSELLYRYRRWVLGVSAVLFVVLSANITRNSFDDRIPTYFAKTLEWRQANDFSEEEFGSAYNFTYSLDSSLPGGVSNPKYLADVEAFTQYLRGLPKVAYVKSITDTFKRLNKSMHGDDPAQYKLPQNAELAAQYLLLYELSLTYGLGLDNQLNHDKSASKMLASFQSMSVSEVLQMEREIDQWLADNLPHMSTVGSGVQIMFAHLMERDTRGLTLGAVMSLLIISLLLVVLLRSVKIGLLSVLPNLVPIALAFGAWGLLVGQVGFGLAMVSGMAIGIIVDDSVHFLSKYLQARRVKGLDAQHAVAHVFETVAPSLIYTTLVLVAGFMCMVLVSEFRVNTDMGKMTSLIMVLALAFDLIVLPVLLMMFDRDSVAQPAQDLGVDQPAPGSLGTRAD